MDGKLKTHQFVRVQSVQEVEDNKCSNESSENDGDDSVPLGLTGKAVCMQVGFICVRLTHQNRLKKILNYSTSFLKYKFCWPKFCSSKYHHLFQNLRPLMNTLEALKQYSSKRLFAID